jgi:hypothetical protein
MFAHLALVKLGGMQLQKRSSLLPEANPAQLINFAQALRLALKVASMPCRTFSVLAERGVGVLAH